MIAILIEPHDRYGEEKDTRCLTALKREPNSLYGLRSEDIRNPRHCTFSIILPSKYIIGQGMYNRRFIFLKEKM